MVSASATPPPKNPFLHNPTLQEKGLPDVTANVTRKIRQQRTSETSVKTKFAEFPFYEVG
jgi:hypothetical protein